jgi:large subunit ribosomal protein L1
MSKIGKRLKAAREGVDREKAYAIDEAIKVVKERAKAKFDETVEVSMNLGVDPKHAYQMLRGVCNLPNGSGAHGASCCTSRGAQGRRPGGRRRCGRRGGPGRAGVEGHHQLRPLHRHA